MNFIKLVENAQPASEMDKVGKCCFCGDWYNNYGNSTSGLWPVAEKKNSEIYRCCDRCSCKIRGF